ncbi:MAG TPA: aldehyde dehydrogenase family protein [Pseudonocardiaceae bacterium]
MSSDSTGTALHEPTHAAVSAARRAFGDWAGRDATERGRVLYRAGLAVERDRDRLAEQVAEAENVSADQARALVDTAVERWLWYAGWADKLGVVFGGANPVAGPFLSVTAPEPIGVVGVLAPQRSTLLGLVSVVAPVLATGNTCVVVPGGSRPGPARVLAEALAGGGLPGGVLNLVSGRPGELGRVLAAHAGVDGLDLTGADAQDRAELERTAANTVKRTPRTPVDEPDWTERPGLERLRSFVELKTVWHTVGT